ncbi:MAG TPA: hypothetical protein VKA54_07105 [Gemmatimonadaceae bacterium]|nr:hypothetical protein [Gemmatimonadaceae bacterium]
MPSDFLSARAEVTSPHPRSAERSGAEAAHPRFEMAVLAVYTLLVSFVSALHEPWKDETQAWRMAIDSNGFAELVRNARYEGHPLLFHVMLQWVGLLSRSWWAAVVLHVIVACVAAWLVLRCAPFTRLQKVLLVFGYWSAYEYSVVVRPYGLGMMFAFAACVAWVARRRRIGWTIVCLLLLANTTAMGTLLAMALAAAFAFDWAWPDDVTRRPGARTLAMAGVATAASALLVLYFAVVQIRPPADAGYQGEPQSPAAISLWEIASIPTVELRALFPIVLANGGVQWNRWVLKPDSRYELALVLGLSFIMLGIGLTIAARRRVSLLFYLVGTVGFLVFFGFLFPGTAHHHGYLFIVWVITAWLAWGAAPSERPRLLRRFSEGVDRMRGNLFVISLIPPVIAAAEVAAADVFTPFADATHVAAVIRAQGLVDAPTIAIVRSHAQAVGAFTDRPVIYPLEGKTLTFVYWGAPSPYDATVRAADSATTALLSRHCRVVLIASPSKDIAPETAARARLIYTTQYRPMSGDRYRVWVVSAPPSARCPTARYPSTSPAFTPQPIPTS